MAGTKPEFDVAEHWLHPEGIYTARLVDYDVVQSQYGPRLKWVFETDVKREDGEPPRLSTFTGMKFGEKAHINKMFTAIGWPIPATRDEAREFDIDSLQGQRCRIQVVHDLQSDGSTWANIKAFASLKDGATPPTEPPKPKEGEPGYDPFEDAGA